MPGHKRLILVFGEHPKYTPEFIAETVRTVYATKKGKGEIRRVNINAAPLDHAGFKTVHDSGIGTYQVFQETYHHRPTRRYHPAGTMKGDYLWRLDSLSRAFEAGCDDVGIGALFGLADWRFEVLGLVTHSRHLMEHTHGVGTAHDQLPAHAAGVDGVDIDESNFVDDHRLQAAGRDPAAVGAVHGHDPHRPRAGRSCARRSWPSASRRSTQAAGSSSAGTPRLATPSSRSVRSEQFELGDIRSLDEVIRELVVDGYMPSFCTACYRLGRTGEDFMEYAIPGFIQRLCTPNALSTLMEYLVDYASPETRQAIEKLPLLLTPGPQSALRAIRPKPWTGAGAPPAARHGATQRAEDATTAPLPLPRPCVGPPTINDCGAGRHSTAVRRRPARRQRRRDCIRGRSGLGYAYSRQSPPNDWTSHGATSCTASCGGRRNDGAGAGRLPVLDDDRFPIHRCAGRGGSDAGGRAGRYAG
jgi:hypothetical protein